MSNIYSDKKIQAMFYLSNKIFEAMYTPYDQRSDKQQEILKHLREKNFNV